MSLSRLGRIAIAIACALAAGCGDDRRGPSPAADARHAEADARHAAADVRIPAGRGHLAVMAPRDGLTVRSRPNGRVIAHLQRRTRWGSPTVAWAVRRRGGWLAVIAPGIANNRHGWINLRRERPRMWRSRLSLHADLSERTLELREGARVRRRMRVTIGGPSSPTPAGRFSVTDKLIPAPGQRYYGCCILALSGTQPKLRPGWAGGNRIAIHGSPNGSVGAAASAGCLRARDADLRALMKVVPVGTPVIIRA
jgi:hypothetical protein